MASWHLLDEWEGLMTAVKVYQQVDFCLDRILVSRAGLEDCATRPNKERELKTILDMQ